MIATNVAETSLTIPSIYYVVTCKAEYIRSTAGHGFASGDADLLGTSMSTFRSCRMNRSWKTLPVVHGSSILQRDVAQLDSGYPVHKPGTHHPDAQGYGHQ